MADTRTRLRQLNLSAAEVKALTGWPDPMVEDYINILQDLIIVANEVDSVGEINDGLQAQVDNNTEVANRAVDLNGNTQNDVDNLSIKVEGVEQLQSAIAVQLADIDGIVSKLKQKISDQNQLLTSFMMIPSANTEDLEQLSVIWQ